MESWEIILLMIVGTLCVALLVIVWAAIRQAGRKASTDAHNDAQAGVCWVTFDEYQKRVSADPRVTRRND